jgi:uroporphyrinogen-III decarboxylase
MLRVTAKENFLRVLRHDKPQWVPLGNECGHWLGPPLIERPGRAGRDAFGVLWDYEEGAEGGTFPAHGGHTIADLAQWRRQITIPDIDALDWSPVAKAAAQVDRETTLVVGFVEMGLFERSYLLLGMDEALMAYVSEPERMYDLLGAVADYKIRLIERFHEEAKLDMLWYGDDWGNQRSLFVPPAAWRRVIRPPTQRIYDCAKARGIMVDQHSCGKVDEILGDVVAMGATCWNPCQPCNDLAGLKKKYGGRICFSGGIDSQFVLHRPGVTGEEVRAEVRKRIDEMAAGGGYIATPSHSVPYNKAIIETMENEIRTYGRAYYART